MNIHYLQHVPFEDLGSIQTWANNTSHKLSSTRFFEKCSLPKIDDIDFLIVMGGPMGVYEEHTYAWLKEEKKFIENAIRNNKHVLGICLGAQLIAEVLGSKVYKNKEKEIGWMDVSFTEHAKTDSYFKSFPSSLTAFHWHGDTFDLPPGAVHIAQSAACENQAFTYGEKVIALQFHLEATEKLIAALTLHCKEEIVEAPYIQKEKDIINNTHHIHEMNQWMQKILNKI